MITIDSGIPLPDPTRKGKTGRKPKYPTRELAVGESFFVAGDRKACASVRSTVSRIRQATGRTYAVRVVEEDGVRGVRVWRTN